MVIKTVEELNAIKVAAQATIKERRGTQKQIIIGMGTCGIAAGAKAVLEAAEAAVKKLGVKDVVIWGTGCIGMCQKEPLLDVALPGQPRVTYGPVTPADVERIVAEHVVGGNIVSDLVVAKM